MKRVGFPCGSAGKESARNAGDLGLIPVLGRSPGEGKGYPVQYSGLENSTECMVHAGHENWTRLSDFHFHIYIYIYTHMYVYICIYVCMCVCALSCSVVSNSLWPHGLYIPWNSPGQNTGVGSLSLLQGIFPTQGSNPGLLHCRQILYHLSHQGSPLFPFSVA